MSKESIYVISIGKYKTPTNHFPHTHFHFNGAEASAEQFLHIKEFIELSMDGYACLWVADTGEIIDEIECATDSHILQ